VNKNIKKYLSVILLGVFTCTIILDHKVHTMYVPAGLLQQTPQLTTAIIQQAPRILMAAGTLIMSFASSLWHTNKPSVPSSPPSATTTITQHQASLTTSIANKIEQYVEQVTVRCAAPIQVHSTCNTVKTETAVKTTQNTVAKTGATTTPQSISIEQVAVQVSERIASQELKKVTLNTAIPHGVTTFTVPGTKAEIIVRKDLPNGVQYSMCDGRASLTIEWSDRLARNEQRGANCRFSDELGNLRKYLWHDQTLRKALAKQLHDTISCLIQTQSPDFIKRLKACIAMQFLQFDLPILNNNVLVTVHDLNHIFFHYDGTVCHKALHGNTIACDSIIPLIDWIDQKIGDIIPRDQYINQQDYNRLKAGCSTNVFSYIYRWFTASTGWYCKMTEALRGTANKFNADMITCIRHCERYEFKEAEQLSAIYKSGLFNDIIDYYKNIQIQHERLNHEALYDTHGIIRIAYSDPLYQQYKLELEGASAGQKNIINQNFLIRHHLKNIMHDTWNIPQSVPACVHDAMYNIIGTDGTALSDATLLQVRIEEVIAAAPQDQHDQLVQAFYLPNGILKEYAIHDVNVQTIKMPASILDASSTNLRQQLNTLIGLRIKNPQEPTAVNKAIDCLQKSLTAKTDPERITFKEQFDTHYNQIGGQPEKAKPSVTPQEDNPPTSGAPVPPPDPNKDKEKVETDKTAKWDMPTSGKKIDGRYYTKHALERMAPDTLQIRAELESRAIKNGYPRFSSQFNKYIQPRNIPPSVVENVIKYGAQEINGAKGTLTHILDGIKVVTNIAGDVVTVHVC
jgi:hypothetical protein